MRQGFTLTELLVATAVFFVILAVVLQLTDRTSKIWRNATSKIQAFQEARAGFDSATRNLAQATLNTYYDYYDGSNPPVARTALTTRAQLASFSPATYDRVSDLHFICGQASTLLSASTGITTQTQAIFFQAPKGYSISYQEVDNALNACGYFLQFDDGASAVPDFIKNAPGYQRRYRFRMMEMTQSTEELGIYQNATTAPNDWFVKNALANSRPIAENVIALVFLPKLSDRQDDPNGGAAGVSLAPNYNYNTRIPLKATSDPSWAGANPPFPPDAFTAYPTGGGTTSATRHHQLPPIVRMIMIVIDEASAARLTSSTPGKPPTAIDLSKTTLFTDATKLDADIAAVEDICNAKAGNLTGNTVKLTYRVFSTDIIMRQAKWSSK
ncbi:hypothetical protein BH09VER1_BH09VER1_31220 [soil metagenome]